MWWQVELYSCIRLAAELFLCEGAIFNSELCGSKIITIIVKIWDYCLARDNKLTIEYLYMTSKLIGEQISVQGPGARVVIMFCS